MWAELKGERCERCGSPLYPPRRRRIRRVLGEWEGMPAVCVYWHVTCPRCRHTNRIWWLADPIGQAKLEKEDRFIAALPTSMDAGC